MMATTRHRAQPANMRLARAFSHEIRIQILLQFVTLGDGAMLTPRDFAETHRSTLGASLGAVADHFRVLNRLGVVNLVRRRAVRGTISHVYSLAKEQAGVVEEMHRLATVDPPAAKRGVGETLVLAHGVHLDDRARMELSTGVSRLAERLAADTTRRGSAGPEVTIGLVAIQGVGS